MATLPNIFSPNYIQQQNVESLRRQAKDQNNMRLALYQSASVDWITNNLRNRDMGLTITDKPTKPKRIEVSDAGVWSEGEWVGLTEPELPAPVLTRSESLRPDPSKVPPDRIDQVIQGLGLLYTEIKSIQASLAELKAMLPKA